MEWEPIQVSIVSARVIMGKHVTHGISWPPWPHDSIFVLLPKRNVPLKVVSWLMVQVLARLRESCQLIDHSGVTGLAVGKSSLRL
jgi:hypothetical protein